MFSKNKDEKTAEEKLGDEAKEKIKDTSRDILKEMDVNLDGKISKDEFVKLVLFVCYLTLQTIYSLKGIQIHS